MGYKYDTSNYIVDIGSNGKYPESFKNVIGFRLVKCIIPVCFFHIKDGHNTFDVTIGGTTYSNISLNPGNYSFVELGTQIQTQLNEMISGPGVFTVNSVTHLTESKYKISHTTT